MSLEGANNGAFTPKVEPSSLRRDEMKDYFWSQPPNAGSRFAERRSVPRFEFIAPVEITEPIKKTHISGDNVRYFSHF